mgnify:CR=1 FL=1
MAEYIDRVVLIETLKNCRNAHADVDDVEGCELIEDVMWEINEQTFADVAPVVHGQWDIMGGAKTRRICSKCRWDVPEYGKFYSYCPNCGARMDEGED